MNRFIIVALGLLTVMPAVAQTQPDMLAEALAAQKARAEGWHLIGKRGCEPIDVFNDKIKTPEDLLAEMKKGYSGSFFSYRTESSAIINVPSNPSTQIHAVLGGMRCQMALGMSASKQ